MRQLNANKTQKLRTIRLRKYGPITVLQDDRPEDNLQPDDEIIIPKDYLHVITWETEFGELQTTRHNAPNALGTGDADYF